MGRLLSAPHQDDEDWQQKLLDESRNFKHNLLLLKDGIPKDVKKHQSQEFSTSMEWALTKILSARHSYVQFFPEILHVACCMKFKGRSYIGWWKKPHHWASLAVCFTVVVIVIFPIVTDIQHINTYFAGYNSWSFHLSNIIAVTYDLNTMNKH